MRELCGFTAPCVSTRASSPYYRYQERRKTPWGTKLYPLARQITIALFGYSQFVAQGMRIGSWSSSIREKMSG